MHATQPRRPPAIWLRGLCLALATLATLGCSTGPPPAKQASAQALGETTLGPFVQMARTSPCAETRNRLYVIDEQLVFWERVGNCPDFSYEQKLWSGSMDLLLCQAQDSIAGPQKTVLDASRKDLFETMVANLTRPDLGLGAGHTVRPVPF